MFYSVFSLFIWLDYISSFNTRVVFASLFFVSGIALTHLSRKIILQFRWVELPISRNIVRVALLSLLMALSTILTVSIVSVLFSLTGPLQIPALKIFTLLTNLSAVYLFWHAVYFSVHYFDYYNRAEFGRLSREAVIKDYELRALKSQMNPHFIFNSLNTIRALIDEDPQKAQTAVTQLSNLLRYSLLVDKKVTVPLEEELQVVNDYLELESLRYEERLSVKMSIAPETLYLKIPPLMVQTLCENGIKHGIAKLKQGGIISVSSCLEDSHLVIDIRNSGYIPEDEEDTDDGGVGVKNTTQRLALLYGSDASFELFNVSKDTVSAKVLIPLRGAVNDKDINS